MAAETTLSEEAFIGDVPVVLSVTRLAQPRSETPAAVTVIDREMIRASGVRKIPDLLWLVPGFQIGYDHGNKATVTYHGLSGGYSKRLQLLIDGRAAYSVLSGGVFWFDIPLAIEDIERIEVIRGPNAAAYGSNSFLAVVNIVTRHAAEEHGGFIKLGAGDHAVRDGFARYSWRTEAGDARLSMEYQKDDGFDPLLDTMRLRRLMYRGDYRLDTNDVLETQLGINGNRYGEGHIDSASDRPRGVDVTSHYQLLRWRHTTAANSELAVQLSHSYWDSNDDYLTEPIDVGPPLGVVEVPVNIDAREDRYDLELQHLMTLSPAWRLVWGGGARLDTAHSRTRFGNDDTFTNPLYRVFGNVEWRARADTIVNAGAMWEKDGFSGTDLLPRLAINHHLTDGHTVRAAASKANRRPTLLEEYSDTKFSMQGVLLNQTTLAMGGLSAEIMRSYELGYLAQPPRSNVNLDVRVFRDEMSNLITSTRVSVPDLDGRAESFQNDGEVTITGAELQLGYRPSADTRLLYNYATMHADASGLSPDAHRSAERHERSVPTYTWSVLAMHRFAGHWEASATYHRVADIEWMGNGDLVRKYGRLDIRLARDFRLDGHKGQIALVVQNLGEDTYSFDAENTFDRRSFVTVSLGR